MSEVYIDKLKKIAIFAEVKDNDAHMAELVRICRPKMFRSGETIIREGDMGDEMFIVTSGAVEIKKRTRAGDDYTVVRLRAEFNVFFGELALIDDDTRSATVMATEDSEFLAISKKDFMRLGDQQPSIGLPITRNIAKILAGRLRKTTVDMLTLFDALVGEIQD